MVNISDLVQSAGWKNFMAKLYGIGASVVILGAMFKITHWPGGTFMIVTGLSVEAIIFFFSAFEPLHEELDWTLVYPELAGISDPDEIENFKENIYEHGTRSIETIEDIISSAGVDEKALKKLGEGLSKIGESAGALAEISGASVATRDFISNLQNASSSVGSLQDVYNNSLETIKDSAVNLSGAYLETADNIRKTGGDIAESYKAITETIQQGHGAIAAGSKEYEQQLSSLGKNLASLNNVYLTQINETSEQMKGSKELYSGLHEMISNLKSSVDETNKYTMEIAKLKESISSLNGIYGNMLNAISGSKSKG